MSEEQFQQVDQWISLYINKEISHVDFDSLKTFVQSSKENREYVRKKIEVGLSSGLADPDINDFDIDRAFERFETKVKEHSSLQQRFLRYRNRTKWLAAAAILLLILLPLGSYWRGSTDVKDSFSDMEIVTANGSNTRLTLPDGSLVWLNAGSKITYSQGFGVADRQLRLEGEGYFEVEHNEKLPFEVKTTDVNLRVLGTQFNFRNYSEDATVTVSLIKGKVFLDNNHNSQSLELNPNEKMTYDKSTRKMTKCSFNAVRSNSWTHHVIAFDDEPLQQIANDLMRAYNVKIEVAEDLKDYTFYGSFNLDSNSIEDILKALSMANQMQYKYQNGKYILYQ
ncbi:MAG: FecR family protein [Prevotella sp.]|nr:FecR family protein [Prevotella sp.]